MNRALGAEAAGPRITLLDLPFRATAMRGPGSEVALSAATSGLLPVARRPPAGADPKGRTSRAGHADDPSETPPVAVVWGETGGAVLSLAEGAVRITLVGAEAIEGIAVFETARGGVPDTRRAVSGPLSATLTGPTRAGGTGGAAGLSLRERRPIGVTSEPKAVPIDAATVPPGADAVFALRVPLIGRLDGRTIVVAVTVHGDGASSLAVVGRDSDGRWAILGRTPSQAARDPAGKAAAGTTGAPVAPAVMADLSGDGRPRIAAVRAPDGGGVLQVWAFGDGAFRLEAEASGYTDLASGGAADLAVAIGSDAAGRADIALPTADRSALAVLSLKDGTLRERARVALPAPAALGLAALGTGGATHVLVGLADGRVAVVSGLVPEAPR